MIARLSHATIYVLDKEKALKFYTEKLGFTVVNDQTLPNGFRWVTIKAPEQEELEIILMEPEAGQGMTEEQAARFRELIAAGAVGGGVFLTNDCRKTYEQYKAQGVEFVSEPQEQFYGVEAVFKDDSGIWYSLTEPK
jgi:catechol 2,3-dioxygenase-like lactoylglutathione lyase family enzyme